MKICLLEVPYHLGQEGIGMGMGPRLYLQANLAESLTKKGFQVQVNRVRRSAPYRDELSAIADVNHQLAEQTQRAIREGYLPMILSGNCNSCLGTLAGFDHSEIGIIWFDTHGDFNTPETSPSGFFDGMGLAIAAGRCHHAVWAQMGDATPIAEENILLAGVRDLDPGEKTLLDESAVRVLPADILKDQGITNALLPHLIDLKKRVKQVYLHLDIDVLDPAVSPGNEFNTLPNGLTVIELEQAINLVAEHFTIRAVALSSYNPDYDPEQKTLKIGQHLVHIIANHTAPSS